MLRDIWTCYGDNNVIAAFRMTCREYRRELEPLPLVEYGDAVCVTYKRGKYSALMARHGRVSLRYEAPDCVIRRENLRTAGARYGTIDNIVWSDHASKVLYIHRAVFGAWPKFTTAMDLNCEHGGITAMDWEVPDDKYLRAAPGMYVVHVDGDLGVMSRLIRVYSDDYDDNVIYAISAVSRGGCCHFFSWRSYVRVAKLCSRGEAMFAWQI